MIKWKRVKGKDTYVYIYIPWDFIYATSEISFVPCIHSNERIPEDSIYLLAQLYRRAVHVFAITNVFLLTISVSEIFLFFFFFPIHLSVKKCEKNKLIKIISWRACMEKYILKWKRKSAEERTEILVYNYAYILYI